MLSVHSRLLAAFTMTSLCLLLLSNVIAADDPLLATAEIEFFEKKIRPVLIQHCYECHAVSAKSIRGGLLLDSASAFRKGGDSGPSFQPGDPAEGTLLDALRHETFEMPPQQKLPDSVIRDFETWIQMGAPDPRQEEKTADHPKSGIDLEQGREFWSFQPIQNRPLPQVRNSDWSASPIDHFILAKIEENDLHPGLDADPLTLLRRVTFDLTGLPPTAEEIEAYLADTSPDRWEQLVDRLLSSRAFGERWGRHWLDLARYSNSTGGGRSLLYGESWRYRNYVINSFNNDKPFDQFIREQIAGDLLTTDDYRERQEQLIATAFLILGPHNYENQDKEQLRMDIVDEQVDTVGRVFLGMTIGCARCHDHKFDPIPTTDYYALAGIFRSTHSTVDGNVSRWVSTPLPLSPEVEQERKQHQLLIAERNDAMKELEALIEQLKSGIPSIVIDNDEAQLTGSWTESTSVDGYVGKNYQHSNDTTASATYTCDVEPGNYEVRISYTEHSNRPRKARVTVTDSKGEKEFLINQRLTPNVNGTYHSLGEFTADKELTVVIQPIDTGSTIIDAVQLIPLQDIASDDRKQTENQLKQARQELKRLKTEAKQETLEEIPQVVSVEEMDSPDDYFVCIRGNAHNLGQPVTRGFLSVINTTADHAIPSGVSGRLELANWIADPENPLTSRVIVNRVWHHLFGAGLVRTVDNFGVPGEKPSHPALLDWLARDFTKTGWSIKQLIRQIVLSRTYQLASNPTDSEERDPENRWLTHQRQRRLTAEALHDALLSASGELNPLPADDTIRAGTKSEYGYTFDIGHRAVYLPVFRNRLPGIFTVFDFPDPNLSNGKRNSSTISPQSLFLMNSDFAYQRASGTAKRVLEHDGDVDERVEWLVLTILNRYPNSDEQRILLDFVGPDPDSEVQWTIAAKALFSSLDFRFLK